MYQGVPSENRPNRNLGLPKRPELFLPSLVALGHCGRREIDVFPSER
jgi:hypothetical protein